MNNFQGPNCNQIEKEVFTYSQICEQLKMVEIEENLVNESIHMNIFHTNEIALLPVDFFFFTNIAQI